MSQQTYAPDSLQLIALRGLPQVAAGDDLGALIGDACKRNSLVLGDDDIVVVAQKIVSKVEGRVAVLDEVTPTERAFELARLTGKPAALVQLILEESVEVLRTRDALIIVEHRLGFVMANAGVDLSNAEAGKAILLPQDPDASAARLRHALEEKYSCRLGVIVSDSMGRAWRNGTIGHAIGVSGVRALLDLRGTPDLFGREMQVTDVGIADEIAAAASALMGQGDEAKPVVIVRGFSGLADEDASAQDLLRPHELDLFR